MYIKLEEIKKEIDILFSIIDEGVEKEYRVEYNSLFFQQSNEKYLPGTYVYVDEKGYHIDYVGDRGGFVDEKIYTAIEDLYFQVCWEKVSSVSVKFASKNRETGKDWRRVMFEKRLELLKMLDINFYEKGKKMIGEILLENPYNDTLLG